MTFDYEPYIKQHFAFIQETLLAERLLFLDENFLQINHSNHSEVADNLRLLVSETNRYPVLCLESNPVDITNYLNEFSNYYDAEKIFVLTWDANPSRSLPANHAYWPTFLLNQRIENTKTNTIQPRHHRISFLSGMVRYHRLKLLAQIQAQIKPTDVVVVNAIGSNNFSNTIPRDLESDAEILKQQITLLPWTNKQKYIDQDQNGWSISNNGGIDHPAYLSCVNITGESWYHSQDIFVTEKTWKAYRAGCLVVNYGAEQMPHYLAKLGFGVWQQYDSSQPMHEKLNSIQELFQRDDIEHLYHKHSDMIQHNFDLFHTDKLALSLCRPAVEKLKNWVV